MRAAAVLGDVAEGEKCGVGRDRETGERVDGRAGDDESCSVKLGLDLVFQNRTNTYVYIDVSNGVREFPQLRSGAAFIVSISPELHHEI